MFSDYFELSLIGQGIFLGRFRIAEVNPPSLPSGTFLGRSCISTELILILSQDKLARIAAL